MKNLIMLALCSSALISCKKDKVPCSSTPVSFASQVKTWVDTKCTVCHGDGGTSPNLTTHAGIANNASKIKDAIAGVTELMPQGGPELPDSVKTSFNDWICQGKLEN